MNSRNIGKFYNIFAEEYARLFFDELDNKPFDRSFLDRFAVLIEPDGLVCDIGCGPGEVARYLKDRGLNVIGLDLSDGMIHQARRLNPDIEFKRGNMLALELGDNELGGISASYAIVNLTKREVETALREFNRVLKSNGILLLSFHTGNNDVISIEKSNNEECVTADYTFFDFDEILKLIKDIGFEIEEAIIRYPYEKFEYKSKKGYIIARKGSQS